MPKKLLNNKSTSEKKQNRGKNKIQKKNKHPKIQGKKTKNLKWNQKKKKKRASMNYKNNSLNLNQTQSYKSRINIPNDFWQYQQYEQPERLSASRNQTYYGGISEEEEKRNQNQNQYKNLRYQPSNLQNDYYDQNSINYYKNEYNQNKNLNNHDSNIKNFQEMQSQYATTQQQKDNNTNSINNQQQNNINQQKKNDQTEKQEKPQENEINQQNSRGNNRERRKYSPPNRYHNNEQYRTRSYSSNSKSSRNSYKSSNRNRSNSRFRRNNNYNYNNSNRNQNYQNNQNRKNNRNRMQQRSQNRQQLQQKQQQQSITYNAQQKINYVLSDTYRYWLNSTCRNPECERKHFQTVQLMNLYHKPRGKRFKNNITDQNNLEQDINKQKFCIQINTTREMTIKQIREYIAKKANKLEEQEINNIEINMAVKDGRKIQQEIHNIINTSLIEMKKEKEMINQTQASLITTEEILKQIISEEFINIRQAFTEINKEQEYQNERSREFHLKQLEKIKQIKEKQNKEMEVEENAIRLSQNIPTFKPQIQQNQFINFQQTQNKVITHPITNTSIGNISEEDKVNKPQTSSEERQITESPKPKNAPINWENVQVDTSVPILQNKPELIKDSLKVVNQAIIDQKIGFSKVNTKQIFKEYLTQFGVETNRDIKEIPTGIYLILIIEAQYFNEAKRKAREFKDKEGLEIYMQAFTEAISTYALGTVAYKIEADKIKLLASRQFINQALNEIIRNKKDTTQQEIQQVRTQTTQGSNLNIIIHLSINFIQDKNRLIDMTKIEK